MRLDDLVESESMKQSVAELVDAAGEGRERWDHQAVAVGHSHICVGMRNAGTAETTAVPPSSHVGDPQRVCWESKRWVGRVPWAWGAVITCGNRR